MSARNKFLIVLAVIMTIAATYYFFSTPGGKDLVLVGTVDANQIVVSPQIQGRILKLLVEEGTQLKQGDLIALLDPSELEAQERAAAATIASMRSQMSASEYTRQSTKGSTSGDVANSQARLQAARAQLAQAEATLARVESDSRRTIGLAQAGVASEQEKVQAEMNLKAQQASVQALKDQVSAGQADLNSAIVTVVDFRDTWVLASIPETDADHIGLGDTLRVRLPGGTVVPGKVFYKAAEADFATQRDVGRRER